MKVVVLSPRAEEMLESIQRTIRSFAKPEDVEILSEDDQVINQAVLFLGMCLANLDARKSLASAATFVLHDAREEAEADGDQ